MNPLLHPPTATGTAKEVRFILGDQLNHHNPWFQEVNADVVYLMAGA